MTSRPFANVALHLPEMARRAPDRPAVVWPAGRGRYRRQYEHLTFAQLDGASDAAARELAALGLRRGQRTVLMVPPSLDFFVLTFALFKLGAVLVLIDPGMGVRNLGRCLDDARPEAFIGVGKAHLARKLLGWGRRTVKLTFGVGTRWFCQHRLEISDELGTRNDETDSPSVSSFIVPHSSFADDPAAILFTSGSTGIAKGAVYTHGTFASQVEALHRLFDIQPGEIDLATFPLFALFAPALGMTAIIPDMDPTRPARVNPANIVEAVEDWGVTNLFGSPALLNAVSRWGVPRQVKLPSLKRVISAGAPVPATVIERITRMLAPGVQVFTPYGATEALPVACIGSDTILKETRQRTDEGAGVCVGRPVPEIEVAIIPVTDNAIETWDESLRRPANEIGEIAVRGPHVTREYFGRPAATTLAKIPDGAGGIWHRMGDVGYRDEVGRLWFCGRKSHRVKTKTGTLYTIPVEAVFNTHAAVFRSALVGVGPPGQQVPVLCVELEPYVRHDLPSLTRELVDLGAKHEHTQTIRRVLYHPRFPVDIRHNAKIFREKLAAWAARQMG